MSQETTLFLLTIIFTFGVNLWEVIRKFTDLINTQCVKNGSINNRDTILCFSNTCKFIGHANKAFTTTFWIWYEASLQYSTTKASRIP